MKEAGRRAPFVSGFCALVGALGLSACIGSIQPESDANGSSPAGAGVVAVQDATLLRTAAESLATAALRNVGALLPCDPVAAGEAPCARQFVDGFGLRAFRRPLTPAEGDHLTALYTGARDTLKLGF